MEYQCYDLDPNFKLFHGDNPVLFETDRLDQACVFIYNRYKELGIECAVFQPRTQGYRDYYKHKTQHDKRGPNGRFVKKS